MLEKEKTDRRNQEINSQSSKIGKNLNNLNMPPKKKEVKGGQVAGQALDEDMSDAASLPLLNDFIFMNIYAFKFRQNRLNLEKHLF